MDVRLPAHLEVAGILRLAESLGGFGMVLAKGERDAGTILLATIHRDQPALLYEKMPQLDGNRRFAKVREEDIENKSEFQAYLERRKRQDDDVWIIEADVPDRERFIASLPQ
jgi:hypothetical protein